jgi:hypothetical protein
LGVSILSEWDALVFLYHHGSSLAPPRRSRVFLGMARRYSELRWNGWNRLG